MSARRWVVTSDGRVITFRGCTTLLGALSYQGARWRALRLWFKWRTYRIGAWVRWCVFGWVQS